MAVPRSPVGPDIPTRSRASTQQGRQSRTSNSSCNAATRSSNHGWGEQSLASTERSRGQSKHISKCCRGHPSLIAQGHQRPDNPKPQAPSPLTVMQIVVALLLVAVLGATAFTPPRLFGPPRTRAQALAYAKKAVFKDADKDADDRVSATPVPPLKGSRQRRVEMIIDPGCVPGARPLSLTNRPCACPASPNDTAPQALLLCPTISCQSRRPRAIRSRSCSSSSRVTWARTGSSARVQE